MIWTDIKIWGSLWLKNRSSLVKISCTGRGGMGVVVIVPTPTYRYNIILAQI